MSYTAKSTKLAIKEYFCEFSRGFGASEVTTFRNGKWALAKIGQEWNAFLRIGNNWHRWHADGSSGSGSNPCAGNCLGDIISTDKQLRQYEKDVYDCPEAILSKVNVR